MNRLRKFTHNSRAKLVIASYSKIIKKNYKVLDIGSYNGFVADKIRQHFKCHVECADLKNDLEYDMYFNLIKDSTINVPYKSFDIAMINDTLHHIPFDEQMNIIKESQRVSKKVLIFETNPCIAIKFMHFLNILEGMHSSRKLYWRNLLEWVKVINGLSTLLDMGVV